MTWTSDVDSADADGEGMITITFNGAAGSDAPRITVHAASFEALELFQGDADGLASLMDRVQSAVQNFTDGRDR